MKVTVGGGELNQLTPSGCETSKKPLLDWVKCLSKTTRRKNILSLLTCSISLFFGFTPICRHK